MQQTESRFRHSLSLLAFVYAVFVIYGNLLPFDYLPRTLDDAIERFKQIPFLSIGVKGREDWIANGVLFIPLGYLCAASIGRSRSAFQMGLAWLLSVLAGALLAVAIEFAQIFFEPRVVSLNDLLAGVVGAALGSSLWLAAGRKLGEAISDFRSGTRRSCNAARTLYLLLFFAVALFPYDFLISATEIKDKLSGDWFYVFQSGSCASARCVASWISEVVATAPIGFLTMLIVSSANPARRQFRYFLLGCVVGLAVETVQIFMHSGRTQVLSILTRGLGVYLGAELARYLQQGLLTRITSKGKLVVCILALVWILVGAALHGMQIPPALSMSEVGALLENTRFIPFHNHYRTSETQAFMSIVRQSALFFPVGFFVWLWGSSRIDGPGYMQAAFWGALAAFGMETGRLVLGGLRPDYTNILIGALAAVVAMDAMRIVYKWFTDPPVAATPPNIGPHFPGR